MKIQINSKDVYVKTNDFFPVLDIESDRVVAYHNQRGSMSMDVWQGQTQQIGLPSPCCGDRLAAWCEENIDRLAAVRNGLVTIGEKGVYRCDAHQDDSPWDCRECYDTQRTAEKLLETLADEIESECQLEWGDADLWWRTETEQVGIDGIVSRPFIDWWAEFLEVAKDANQYLDREEFEAAYDLIRERADHR